MTLWEDISDYLNSKGFPRVLLTSFMEFIDAPEKPIELRRIMVNLSHVLSNLSKTTKLYPPYLAAFYDPDWASACRAILSYPRLVEELKPSQKKRKVLLWGFHEQNPEYVALWVRPEGKAGQERYYGILAHACMASSVLRNEMAAEWKHKRDCRDDNDKFDSSIERAFLAIRKLAYSQNKSILESLPDLKYIQPQRLLAILENSNEICAPIALLLKYMLKIKEPPNRIENEYFLGDPWLHLPARVVELSQNNDPEQALATSVDLLQLPAIGEKEADRLLEAGLSPDESYSGVEIAVSNKPPVRNNISSPAQKAMFGRRVKAHISMSNQRLANRWEMLSLHEMSMFLSAVSHLIAKAGSSHLSPDTDPLELATLLVILFWYGKHLENALQLHCYYGARKKNSTKPGFILDFNGDGYMWVSPAVPDRIMLLSDLQKSLAHHTVSNFAVSTGIGVEKIISKYVITIHRKRSKYLFPRPIKDYERMVDEFFSLVNRQHSLRLTCNRISDYLFEKLSSREGSDITVAMFVTGREHFLGRNLAYYTALPVSTLQSVFRDVCAEIREQHFSECRAEHAGKLKILPSRGIVPTSSACVGSPFRPTIETVRALSNHLKDRLVVAADAEDMSILRLLRLHNSVTRYTIFMIGYGTGFRAVRDPLFCVSEVDWKTGFAVIHDKDGEDRYNSRLVWIPPPCLEQLRLYRQHMNDALYIFHTLIPDLAHRLKRRRNISFINSFFAKNDTNEELDAMTIGPGILRANLRAVHDLPMNANRHFLRSCLMERGCPVEIINAFQGHWERGEEPWGRYSGLSPIIYRNELARYLIPLLKESGWCPMAGFRRKRS